MDGQMSDIETMESRCRRLKAATSDVHERLDQRIMAARPFDDRERYGRFLTVQLRFHRDIDGLYQDPGLAIVLPELAGRRRLPLIEQDLADLGLDATDAGASSYPDPIAGLGWLYVAEGSNLGAAFLFKAALGLGLSDTFGARHLAPSPVGRGAHWRAFTAAVDSITLSEAEEARAAAGAQAAFRAVHGYVEDLLE